MVTGSLAHRTNFGHYFRYCLNQSFSGTVHVVITTLQSAGDQYIDLMYNATLLGCTSFLSVREFR